MKRHLIIATLSAFLLGFHTSTAQEIIVPLSSLNTPSYNGKGGDTLTLELPFFDDFSDYDGQARHDRWLQSQALVNKNFAPKAPTIGMATLDALDADGNLYPHASTNLFAADTLTSQILRLDSLTGASQRKLQPTDSVSLSFYYVPGGWYGYPWELVGDAPAVNDSLFLDFYDHNDGRWNVVWASGGFNADTSGIQSHWPWRYAYVKIDNAKYFNKHFQFRFRNYASLDPNPKTGISGNCDQWNIDYIYINYNRSAADSFSRDIAFVEKAPSMLRHYIAMPARQFKQSDMATNIEMTIVNRYNQTLASTYSYSIEDAYGQQVASYDGGYENISPFFPNGTYQNSPLHSKPPVNFTFPVNGQQAEFRITHVVREGVSGDIHNGNDTLRFIQTFANYYAYDDGTPENGYGLTAPGNKVWLACRYDLNVHDTLTAVDLYFNRTRNNENADIPFHLCIWKCENGLPSTLIYKDPARLFPSFDGMNNYHRYALTTPVVVSDTVFIGFEQLSNDFINLGFDRSNDSRQYTFYRTAGDWMQSILCGSVMMRPLFGSEAVVGISKPHTSALSATIFPTPASDILHIRLDGDAANKYISIIDMKGISLLDIPYTDNVDLHNIPNGIYIIRILDTLTRQQSIKKLIIKR